MKKVFNNRFLRERGMASNQPIWNTRFFLHFSKELSFGYLRCVGNGKFPLGKFLWEGRERGLPSWLAQFSRFEGNGKIPLSQFSFAKLRQPTGHFFSLPSQRNFPISLKPKVAIAKFIGKMQKKSLVS